MPSHPGDRLINRIGRFFRKRFTRVLVISASVALALSIMLAGEAAFLALIAFTILLPAALVSALVRWWPYRRARRRHREEAPPWYRVFYLVSFGVAVTTILALIIGVAAFGTAVGIILVTTGLLLLPPAIILSLLALSMRYRLRVGGTAFDPEKQLGSSEPDPGEEVLYEAQVHWGVFVPPILVLSLSAFFAIAPFGIIGQVIATLLYIVLFPGMAAYALGVFFDTELRVTRSHLISETGLILVHSRVVPRHTIQSVGVYYSWLGRLLGYGWLVVVIEDGTCFLIPGIVDPEGMREFLYSWPVEPARLEQHGAPPRLEQHGAGP